MGKAISVSSIPRCRDAAPSLWPLEAEQEPLLSPPYANKSTVPTKKGPILLSFEEAPHWLQDNEYILSGYRRPNQSVTDCIASLTYVHNETANIYTHMIPGLFLVVGEILLYQNFLSFYPEATEADRLVFASLLFAALICMSFSTAYHTLMSHSHSVSRLWLQMDYLGIMALILGNILTGTYMVFYCIPHLIWLYWGTLINYLVLIEQTLTLGSLSCMIILHPKLQGQEWRNFRTGTFACTGLSSLAPLAHATLMFGLSGMFEHSGLPYYLLEGLLHITGVFFYASRIPESLNPGQFDIWFSSHQIFHVLAVLATVAQVFGVWHAFDYNYTNGLACDAS
uniref:Adiponectin receptor protein 1 n=1 Tax=Coccidioides posadasii RMSCC 3488 TaxID=454284 RepID=A0A0J6FMJ3_COCPO|nr:adiponectin receptor protein 1 [Coccidioides posadasii RMSCC 3488]